MARRVSASVFCPKWEFTPNNCRDFETPPHEGTPLAARCTAMASAIQNS